MRKHTVTVWIEKEPTSYHSPNATAGFSRYHYFGDDPPPATMADCQRLTNAKVVAIRRSRYGDGPDGDERIRLWKEWDGQSYLPCYGFFCTNNCAGMYARRDAAARNGIYRRR